MLDLRATPTAQRTPAQRHELRRALLLRTCATSPGARLAHALLAAAAAAAAMAYATGG